MVGRIQLPKDVTFDFNQPLNRIQHIRKQTGKYNEITRDFLDEIQLIQEHLEYIVNNQPLLSLVCSGPKSKEWEQRLTDARDYLDNLNTFPGNEDYDKCVEDELVKVANNLEEITTEIHLVRTLKNRPLEPIDIYEALHIHQGVIPLHGSITDAWANAKPEEREYCERLANMLRQMPEYPKPKREKGMGQKYLPEEQKMPSAQQQRGQNIPEGQQTFTKPQPTLPMEQQNLPTGQQYVQPPQQQFAQQNLPTSQQYVQPPQQQYGQQNVPSQQQQQYGGTTVGQRPVIIAHEESVTIEKGTPSFQPTASQIPTQPGYFQPRPK